MLSVQKIRRRRLGHRDIGPSSDNVNVKPTYQMMFLTNDRQQRVFVDETEELDFQVLRDHLRRGESVFITSRPGQKQKTWRRDSVGRGRRRQRMSVRGSLHPNSESDRVAEPQDS